MDIVLNAIRGSYVMYTGENRPMTGKERRKINSDAAFQQPLELGTFSKKQVERNHIFISSFTGSLKVSECTDFNVYRSHSKEVYISLPSPLKKRRNAYGLLFIKYEKNFR
jgi:hypothetical protein